MDTEIIDKILSKCVPYNECLVWTGAKSPHGYGRVRIMGVLKLPHRALYEAMFGIVENDIDVCHSCDNRLCCNYNHLFLGTRSDNMRDARSKGRLASGDRHPTRTNPEKYADGWRSISKYAHAPDGTKWCYSCQRFLRIDMFSKNKSKRSGLEDACRNCRRERYITEDIT